MIATVMIVQGGAAGLSLLPVVWTCRTVLVHLPSDPLIQVAAVSFLVLPAYAAFATIFLVASPLATRLARWQTPDHAAMRITELDWPLLDWARYNAGIHFAAFLTGWLFRATPMWSVHLRCYGARIGRRVFINSPHLADYNLLEFGDDVVIGADAHVSGHTVEGGIVKTGGVRLGRGVTVGVGSMLNIDVSVDDGCQIGAMSFVPKHAHLRSSATYVGVPVHRIA